MRRLVARLSALAAFVGFAGLVGGEVLQGVLSQHNETLVLDSAP